MIEKLLKKIPYIDSLITELEKYRVLASVRQDSIIEVNEKNRDLENQLTGCKARIRELQGNQEILEFNLQKRDREIEEYIKANTELYQKLEKAEKELQYYKKAFSKIYQENGDISFFAMQSLNEAKNKKDYELPHKIRIKKKQNEKKSIK